MTRVVDARTHALLKDRFAREQAAQMQAYQRHKREEAEKVKDGQRPERHRVTKADLKRQQLERLRADIAAIQLPDVPAEDPRRYRRGRFQSGAATVTLTSHQHTSSKAKVMVTKEAKPLSEKMERGSASSPTSPSPLPVGGQQQRVRYMRPVGELTTDLLYDGVSSQGKGRKSYLKARNDLDPDQKYYLPLISSWDYGWCVGSWMSRRQCGRPQHCFTTIIPDTFYRRNGVPLIELQQQS